MKKNYKKNIIIFFLGAKKKAGKKIMAIIAFLLLCNMEGITQNTSYRKNSIPISGTNCSAFGYKALFSNTIGSWNAANGYTALSSNTTGDNNTANGARALYSNTTGNKNTANGYRALYSNTTGEDNTANGFNALGSNTYGVRCTAIGANALSTSISGWDNTALGMNALRLNTNGTTNTATGIAALYFNTSGGDNTASGAYALMYNVTGNCNTAIGNEAFKYNVIGSYNTGLGFKCGVTLFNESINNSTALGAYALVNISNKIRLGDASVTVVEGPALYTVSDERFTKNISEDVKGLEFIKLLRPVVYNFDTKKFQKFLTRNMPDSISNKYMDKEFGISTSIRQSGFIAQEVEKAALQTGYDFNGIHTSENENDNYSLGYSQFVVPLVKGMQEQQQMIDKQQQQINKQQQEIDALKKAIAAIHNTSSGLESALTHDLQIYPNPGKGVFILRTKGIETGIIEVVNLEGKIIYGTDITNSTSEYKIDLSAYPRGIYLVTISSNGEEITSRKLMIE